MFKYSFKNFDFYQFSEFIHKLIVKYDFWGIRFYPPAKYSDLFNEQQLTHVTPSRFIDDPKGFLWAWRRCLDKVKEVTFDFSTRDKQSQIRMTINLSKKNIALDKITGQVSELQVEDVLRETMQLKNYSMVQKLAYFIVAHVGKFIFAIATGLIIAYLVYKFGWTG